MSFPTAVLIDDSAVFLGLLVEFLERPQPGLLHVVATARDGVAGIEAVATHHPDAAIVDLVMPGMSGIEVIEWLRATHPGLAIIAISSCSPDEFEFAAMQAGADAFVSKDQLRIQLPPAVERAVRLHACPTR